MTARKPRPVVRVVIEVYPKGWHPQFTGPGALKTIERDATDYLDKLYCKEDDRRRPRVVSVKKVKGGRK